jgi:hypothetical protein
LTLTYDGSSVESKSKPLATFTNQKVINNLPDRFVIPARIEAEDFYYNNGFVLEDCSDAGNGYNTAYTARGDYLDYLVYIPQAGHYAIDYRVATERSNAELVFQIGDGVSFVSLDTIKFSSTNGWQNWQTQAGGSFYLEEGYFTIRLLVKQGEHNLNWFRISNYNTIINHEIDPIIKIYPNPANDFVFIELSEKPLRKVSIVVHDISGRLLLSHDEINTQSIKIDTHEFMNGSYFVRLSEGDKIIGLTNIVINR